jgi:hypothetical protein
MPIEVSKDIAAVDAARLNAAAAARDEVSVHKSEEEKGMLGVKASWSFVSTSPAAASVHPIEEIDDKDLPYFHDNDLPSFHIKRLRKLRFRVAANRNNGNLLSKQQNNTKEQEFSRCSGSTTVVVEQEGAAVCRNHTTTAPKGDDERQKLMQRENLQKLSDEVVADVVPQHMTALALDNLLSDGKLGVMSSSIPQEQGDASFDEKPPTRRDLPAEASKNVTEEAEEIAEAEALVVGLHEAPKPASLVTANSQEEMDMTAATSRESKGETVVPFAHDPITSRSDETEASHVHAAKEEEEEAIEVHTMPTSIKDAIRDVSLPDPQDLEEEESPNKHDEFLAHGKQGESAAADDNELLVGHYYTTQNGDIPDPSDSDDRSSQGRDSVSSFATIHTRSDGDSSKLCERSSVSDVGEAYTDVAGVPSSRSIRYSSSILAAYSSGSILYPGAPNHSGSISHRSDSSAASNRSFAFPIFATDGNSSPVRMAQPDQRYLRRKKWRWQTSCTCCSRASPTYY